MSDQTHLELLHQGVDAWNAWRAAHPELQPDLSGADLSGLELAGAYLVHADLRGADLRGTNLNRAKLAAADLRGTTRLDGANLYRAILSSARLEDAVLDAAALREAQLNGTLLTGASLRGADLRGAFLTRAELSGADLAGARLLGADLEGAVLVGARLEHADCTQVRLHRADLSKAQLVGTRLERASLVDTSLVEARLSDCTIHGVSVWNVDLAGAAQERLVVTAADEPRVTVDDLEVAQFIHLLLVNRKIRNVIETITSKAVLILGRFTAERKAVLDELRLALRGHDLLPILFDFDRPATRSLQETVGTIARLSRFVIADITDPKSIPQELLGIVQTTPSVPVQPILLEGAQPWSMFESIAVYPWVLPVLRYRDRDDLMDRLRERVVEPAQAKARELEKRLREVERSMAGGA